MHSFYKNKKVIVTGHTGFKGAWLSLWLQRMGAKVIGYALPPPTEPSLFKAAGLEGKMSSKTGDIRDFSAVCKFVSEERPEMVFHAAAQSLVRESYLSPVETFSTNVMGTAHVLEACRGIGSVRAIVVLTSDKCYEQKEGEQFFVEDDRLGGHDPYSNSKASAEFVVQAYNRSYWHSPDKKIFLASARAGNVIGGCDWAKERLLPDCIRALTNGRPVRIRYPDAVRPWQHVVEPLYGYLKLGMVLYNRFQKSCGAWNFGPGKSELKQVRWIVERVVELWGSEASWEFESGEKPHEAGFLGLDCSKAEKNLAVRARWSVETALQKTIELYKAFYAGEDVLGLIYRQINDYERLCQY